MLRVLWTVSVLGCAVASEVTNEESPVTGLPDADPSSVTLNGAPDAAAGPADAAPAPDAPAPCAEGQARAVDPVTGGCYMLFTGGSAWYDAKAACENMLPRAHLVTISDLEEGTLVAGLAGGGEPWIGLNDVVREGTYGWVTGEPFAFTQWASGEPNNTGDCVRLQGGRWADLDCSALRPYLCERD
jgi:hypothetical protein